MSARNWDRAIAFKLAIGFALAATAPIAAIIADQARVARNRIRLGHKP